MTQSHNPPSECPRLGGAGTTRKALRTVHGTAVSGMWVNGTCPCDPCFGIGAISGAVSACIGVGVGSCIQGGGFMTGILGGENVVAPTGFINAFCVSAPSCGIGSFMSATGNSFMAGDSFGTSMKNGLNACWRSALCGGAVNGTIAGFDSVIDGGDFFLGTREKIVMYDGKAKKIVGKDGHCLEDSFRSLTADDINVNHNAIFEQTKEAVPVGDDVVYCSKIGDYVAEFNNQSSIYQAKFTKGVPAKDFYNGQKYILIQENSVGEAGHAVALNKSICYQYNNGLFRNTTVYRYNIMNPASDVKYWTGLNKLLDTYSHTIYINYR